MGQVFLDKDDIAFIVKMTMEELSSEDSEMRALAEKTYANLVKSGHIEENHG
jgi:hypothetical protein